MNKTNPVDGNDSHSFWVGIHQVYPKNRWGYRSDGNDFTIYSQFLTRETTEEEKDAGCSAVIRHSLIQGRPCNNLMTYVCELGKPIVEYYIKLGTTLWKEIAKYIKILIETLYS